jgi:hypothetical protein
VSVKSIILILLASPPTTSTKLDFNSFFSELGYHLVLIAKQEPVPSEHGIDSPVYIPVNMTLFLIM